MLKNSSIEGIAIAGATTSGKSALGLKLAEQLNALLINADSAQVYADLRILTARPSDEDEKKAPHALYGVIDGAEAFSAATWARRATQLVEQNKGKHFPILVGGTGLYFRALFTGLADLPPIPDEIRRKWRTRAEITPAHELHEELKNRDPGTAQRLARTDRQRIVRALEVIEATGKSLSEIQAQPARALLDPAKWLRIVLDADRAVLDARIAERCSAMLSGGATEEVKALLLRKLDPGLPVMKAIGVLELSAHLADMATLAEAGDTIALATRQYAKRQETWFRNQMADWQKMTAIEAEKLVADLLAA